MCIPSSGGSSFPSSSGLVYGDGNVFCDDEDDTAVGLDNNDVDCKECNNARRGREADTSVLMLYDLLTSLLPTPELSHFSPKEKFMHH